MNLRSHLTGLVDLLDQHPDIETKKFSPALTKSLEAFEKKFHDAVKLKDGARKWEKVRSDLLKLSPEALGAEVHEMDEKSLIEFCKFFGAKTVNATSKLTRRQNAEAKILKKLKEIGKQLY